MKNFLSTATTVVLTLCALVLTGILVRREFFPGITATAPREVEHWSQLASAGHTMGPANAPVRILEFSDFQCPYCARLQPTLQAIRAKYPDRVAVVYRHFPLADHPHAMQAALASECAAAQGRFERFHDILFAAPDSISLISSRIAIIASQKRSSSAFDSLSVGSIMRVPGTGNETVGA